MQWAPVWGCCFEHQDGICGSERLGVDLAGREAKDDDLTMVAVFADVTCALWLTAETGSMVFGDGNGLFYGE